MGEIKIKSGNLFVGELEQGSLNSNDGSEVVNNTRVRTVGNTLLKEGTYTINCVGTTGGVVVCAYNTDDLSYDKAASYVGHWRSLPFTFVVDNERLYRFAFKKANDSVIVPSEITNIQLLEGTYTSETIPEYQPYFLNKPAHKYVNGEWIDIPTHKYTNGRWQGELTSQSPLKFWADGEMLDWRIEGRTSGNLIDNWEYGDIDTNGIPVDTTDLMRTGYIPIEVDKIYSISREITTGYWKVRIYDINKTYIGSGIGNIDLLWNIGGLTPANPMQNGTSFTKIKPIAENGYFMRFVCSDVNFSENAMMVEGDYIPSTIPEYEPYGGVGDYDETAQKYRIPVTVNGVTTNLFTDHQLMEGDSIDYTTDQTSIPLATGNNVLTVDTAVQPKSVFVKFEG